MTDISERIKQLRKVHLKMSREKFAEILGTSASVIYNIENNRLKNPTQKNPLYKLICEKFHVNEEWLMNGVGEVFMNTKCDEDDSDEKSRLIAEIMRLDDTEWQVIKKLAAAILNKKE